MLAEQLLEAHKQVLILRAKDVLRLLQGLVARLCVVVELLDVGQELRMGESKYDRDPTMR